MVVEWKTARLGDVAHINQDSIDGKWSYSHIRYIDISSVGEGHLLNTPEWMPLSDAPSRAKRLLRMGDTVLSTVRPNRRSMFFASEPGLDWVVSTGFAVLRPKTAVIDPRFLYACVFGRSFTEHLISREKGAAYPAIATHDIADAEIPLPPLPEQRIIASLLGALDDKIDLNRQMNETLEATARLFFKDWFVDFGPTRTKAEDRSPYLAPDLWSLFPDALDDDDKPLGWNVEAVYDQAIWVNGAAYKDMHFSSEPDALPVVKIAELKSGITKSTRFTNTDLGERYKIRDGELLFSWSGNPDTSIDTFVWTSGDAWLNQHIFAVRPNGKRSQTFLYAMLKLLRSEFAEIARNKQTTGLGHVTQQDLIRLKITAPSESVQIAFDEIVGPLHSRFTNNLFENQALIATRDFLLPKLMSGEISLREAEKLVEKVA